MNPRQAITLMNPRNPITAKEEPNFTSAGIDSFTIFAPLKHV